MLNGFWYVWHKKKSEVGVVYGGLDSLIYTKERFDVVIAGALIEHLSDPVTAIGNICRLATETVILAFTPVAREPGEFMKPLVPWTNPDHSYVWWVLSEDMYRAVFRNLGFSIEFKPVSAVFVRGETREEVPRCTIVATRFR